MKWEKEHFNVKYYNKEFNIKHYKNGVFNQWKHKDSLENNMHMLTAIM